MRRSANFIEFPGTGMWMVVETGINVPIICLYRSFPKDLIYLYATNPLKKLFWIDQGVGASTLLHVSLGGKSTSATEVTHAF